jgi:hypothetical protein
MAIKYSTLYRAAEREKPAIALLLVHLMQSMKPSGGKNNSLLLLTRYCKNRTRK